MNKIENIQGKLFFCIYNLWKNNEINDEERGKLKDLTITNDPKILNIISEFEFTSDLL